MVGDGFSDGGDGGRNGGSAATPPVARLTTV